MDLLEGGDGTEIKQMKCIHGNICWTDSGIKTVILWYADSQYWMTVPLVNIAPLLNHIHKKL